MQQKTNTVRVEPHGYVKPAAAETFARVTRVKLVHSREPIRYDVQPYNPIARREPLAILALAAATSLAVLAGTLALMVA